MKDPVNDILGFLVPVVLVELIIDEQNFCSSVCSFDSSFNVNSLSINCSISQQFHETRMPQFKICL